MDERTQNIKENTTLVSFSVNIFLVIIKLFFAYMSNTTLLLLDAAHSLVDSIVSLTAFASIRIKRMKKDSNSIVYMQLENLAGIIISLVIIFGAYEVLKTALEPRLFFGDTLPNFPLAIIGTLISIGTLYFISRYKVHMGGKTNSPAIVADGYDSWMDMYSSIAVLVSLLGSLVGISLNKIAGFFIALLIFKLGVESLIRSVKSLLKSLYADMDNVNGNEAWNDVQKIDTGKYLEKLKNIWKYAIITGLIIYILSGIYVVETDEQGIVKRFGKETGIKSEPGIHYHLPWPIEKVVKTRVTQVNRMELGFRLEKVPYRGDMSPELWESVHGTGDYRKKPDESLMITGDENIVDINLIIQYRINDPSKFLFTTREPHRVIRNVVEASIREVIGYKSIDEALTTGKSGIQAEVESHVQKTLVEYDSGLHVLAVQLQDVHPPIEVADAFKDVASAREDKNRIINDADAYKNEVLPKARGSAQKIIQEAEAYKSKRINMAEGDVDRFIKLYEEYKQHKNTTKTRLYLETIEKVLPNTKLMIIDPKTSNKNIDYSTLYILKEMSNTREEIENQRIEKTILSDEDDYDNTYFMEDEDDILIRSEKTPTIL